MFKMYRGKIANFMKTKFTNYLSINRFAKSSLIQNKNFVHTITKNFASSSESGHYHNKVDIIEKSQLIDINPANIKIVIPYFCSIFQLAEILKVDMLELVNKYKDTINQDIVDLMEYLPKDDLELFLLENEIDFEIEQHQAKMISRPMVVTIMGHVDHGKDSKLIYR